MTTGTDEGPADGTARAGGSVVVLKAGDVPRHRTTGWWVAPAYLAMSLVLLPWSYLLLSTLPDRAVSENYRLAWVGFDVLLALSMARTAWLAWRRSPFVVNVASATATLLVVDAWFDVTTAPRDDLVFSCALAVVVELPLAMLSLIIAGRAQVQIARTGALRPQPAWTQAWRRARPRDVPPVEGVPPAARPAP